MAEGLNDIVLQALRGAFGSDEDADCDILFCREGNALGAAEQLEGSVVASVDTVFGDPLPAHRIILRPASDVFKAKLERWRHGEAPKAEASSSQPGGQQPSQPSRACRRSRVTAALAAATTGPLVTAAGRPQLCIPLGSEAEVPFARAAIRFAYTGQAEAESVRGLLLVRRQADYMEIKGCAAACDQAILSKLEGGAANPVAAGAAGGGVNDRRSKRARTAKAPGQQQQPDVEQLYELYNSQELWPDPVEEVGSFAAILAVGQPLLVAHFRDALATLNTPPLRQELLALPAVALEALLSSDDFGTDSESSILLLLAEWMAENYASTDVDTCLRLCRTVRLAQLSKPYLSLVLPALAADHEKDPDSLTGWFPLTVLGAAFITNFAGASEAERERLLGERAPWGLESLKAGPRPQCIPPQGASYSWHMTREAMQRFMDKLQSEEPCTSILSEFDELQQEGPGIYAWGFEWQVRFDLYSGQQAAGLFLNCELPAALAAPGSQLEASDELPSTLVPISAHITVHRWQQEDGARNDVKEIYSSSEDLVCLGRTWGSEDALPLRQPLQQPPPLQLQGQAAATGGNAAAAAADPLAAVWGDYLRDGKITGSLQLRRPA